MPTVTPFHRAVVADPAFAPADPTRSSRSTPAGSRPSSTTRSLPTAGGSADAPEAEERQSIVVEVGGKRLEVTLPGGLSLGGGAGGGAALARRRRSGRRGKAGAAASGDSLTAPMQGTIVKVAVEEGQTVAAATSSWSSRR
jgi:acetyl-CoA/propionyl-CoA carboxylase biotin carboxyl carrier protein